MTARLIDALGARLTDALFAVAYRATIPVLADAKHTTVRACKARLDELSHDATDISDVVEMGVVTEKDATGKLVTKSRVIAVPVTVHVGDGAELICDDKFSPTVVSFEVNGIPEVQIVNLGISSAEQADLDAAQKEQLAMAAKNADAAFEKQLADAKEQGKREALLEEAKKEGAASVAKPVEVPEPPAGAPVQ